MNHWIIRIDLLKLVPFFQLCTKILWGFNTPYCNSKCIYYHLDYWHERGEVLKITPWLWKPKANLKHTASLTHDAIAPSQIFPSSKILSPTRKYEQFLEKGCFFPSSCPSLPDTTSPPSIYLNDPKPFLLLNFYTVSSLSFLLLNNTIF